MRKFTRLRVSVSYFTNWKGLQFLLKVRSMKLHADAFNRFLLAT